MSAPLCPVRRERGRLGLAVPASFLMTEPEEQGERDRVTSAHFIPDQTPAGSRSARPPPPGARGPGEKADPALRPLPPGQGPARSASLSGLENTRGRLEAKRPSAGPRGRSTRNVHVVGPREGPQGRPATASMFVDAFEHLSNWIPSSYVYDKYSNGAIKGL